MKKKELPGNCFHIDEIERLLEQEIDWCICHPTTDHTANYQYGFVMGLKQALSLLKMSVKVVMREEE